MTTNKPELCRSQPCGCVVCICEHETKCMGFGAKHCGTHPVGHIPVPAYRQPEAAHLVGARAEFEAWITSPPYEKPVTINTDSSAWPGQYRAYEVQLAWEAYQAGRAESELLRAAIRRLCNLYEVDDYYEGQLREERLEAAVNRAIEQVKETTK